MIIFILLSVPILNIQSGFAVDNDSDILITLKDAKFAPLTTVNGNQILVSVVYEIHNDYVKGEKINGILDIYASNGSLIKSSSYPEGFKAKKKGGIQDFKTTIKDPMIQNITANLTLTNLMKTKLLSNTIKVNLELKKISLNSGTPLVNYTITTNIKKETDILDGTYPPDKKVLEQFTFLATGDFGCSKTAQITVETMKSINPDLIFALGDLSYNKLPDCWINMIDPINEDRKVKFVVGEHDIDDNYLKYNSYLKYFNLTKPFYSFDSKNIHFIVMASAKNIEVPYTSDSEQYAFVKADLEKTSQNKNIDWIIVVGSRPFYSSPSTHKGTPELRDIYHPLFDKYGVDLVLYSHNHNYQRTFPINYNKVSGSQPIITNEEKEIYDQTFKRGPIFVTVGTAGETLYPLTSQAYFVIKQFLEHGFLNVSFKDNGSTMEGTFYSLDKSSVEDKFIIKKDLNN